MIIDSSQVIYKTLQKAIICLESASSYNGLSSYPPTPIKAYKEQDIDLVSNVLVLKSVRDLDLKHTNKIREGLYVTNDERTICELILYKCSEELILQSLDRYSTRYLRDLKELMNVSKEYNVEKELLYYIDEMASYYLDN